MIKKIILGLMSAVFLAAAATGAMYFSGYCPPAGPWPMPPWCSVAQDFEYRTLDYINYPASAEPRFALGMGTMDIWGNPHLFVNLGEDTAKNYQAALKRIGQTGSSAYLFTDFINLGQGTEIKFLDRQTFPATYNITQEELKQVAAAAKGSGQKRVFMLTNLSDTKNEITGFIDSADRAGNLKEALMGQAFKRFTENSAGLTSAESLRGFDDSQWREFLANLKQAMLAQAAKAESAGATDFVVNPGDVIVDYYYPGSLSAYWQEVAAEAKKVFSGKVGFFGYPDLLVKTDLKKFDFVVAYFEVRGDKPAAALFSSAAGPEGLAQAWQKYFARDFWKGLPQDRILLATIPSYRGAATGGWIEPGELHAGLSRDDAEQARLYEALFEAASRDFAGGTVISYGYWWSPNMYPKSRPLRNDLSHSIRDKDAESVFNYWAARQKQK